MTDQVGGLLSAVAAISVWFVVNHYRPLTRKHKTVIVLITVGTFAIFILISALTYQGDR